MGDRRSCRCRDEGAERQDNATAEMPKEAVSGSSAPAPTRKSSDATAQEARASPTASGSVTRRRAAGVCCRDAWRPTRWERMRQKVSLDDMEDDNGVRQVRHWRSAQTPPRGSCVSSMPHDTMNDSHEDSESGVVPVQSMDDSIEEVGSGETERSGDDECIGAAVGGRAGRAAATLARLLAGSSSARLTVECPGRRSLWISLGSGAAEVVAPPILASGHRLHALSGSKWSAKYGTASGHIIVRQRAKIPPMQPEVGTCE